MIRTLHSKPTGSFGSPRDGSRNGRPPSPDGPRTWGLRRPGSRQLIAGGSPMGPKVYISGKLYDKLDAKISVFDHGLLYGDGVFEGIRAYSGRVFRLTQHVDRLYESSQAIHLQIPMSREDLAHAVADTLKVNGLTDAYIRVVVTRGAGSLG